MAEQERIMMTDDSCLFCGRSGGHLFIGTRKADCFISDNGWLCVKHLADCEVQICPDCVKRYNLKTWDGIR